MRISSVCLTVGVTLIGSLPRYVSGDACHLRELDLCAATAATINKIPVTEAEIDKYCALGIEAKQCVTTFLQHCATPLQREIINFITEGAMKTAEKFCTKGDELRNQYLAQAACLAKAQPEAKMCFEDVRAGLERLEVVNFEDRITTACCIFSRYKKCTIGVVESQCGEGVIEYGELVAKMAIGNTINGVCHGFDTNPVCESLLPPPGTRATGNSKSIVSKLFNVYASM